MTVRKKSGRLKQAATIKSSVASLFPDVTDGAESNGRKCGRSSELLISEVEAEPLKCDGGIVKKTVGAIRAFQKAVLSATDLEGIARHVNPAASAFPHRANLISGEHTPHCLYS